ncbi:hypothetical protein LJC10_05710 [Selenomonadales bacterium OttesenSCG-928-I06]|nr:hypothetical protein [Selenomonadales bacterium OttesenSCG-928-I06]
MKKLLKILLILLIGVVVLFFIYWGAAILKCEYLTYQYGKEFETGYKETNMIDSVDYFKVLDYSDTSARVYYVSEYSGNILRFSKEDGQWVYKNWSTVWSKGGNADEIMWPYVR